MANFLVYPATAFRGTRSAWKRAKAKADKADAPRPFTATNLATGAFIEPIQGAYA